VSFSDWLSLIWHILYPSIVVFVVLFAVWRITSFLINSFKRLIQKIDGTYPTNQKSFIEGYNGERYRVFRKKDKYGELMDDMNRKFQEDSLRFSEESLRESMRFQ
jgi:hypothetical protein